ncbi:hypothetical protein RB195_002787 [Necator americanus]|uniref:Uncharacterized protein n=1 Tax=Necator americanus TaxID=51031 RepID=A0ABR1DKN9_NECAM
MSSDVLERKNRYEESFQSRVMNEWAKMSHPFWVWFSKSGKEILRNYNINHGTKILFIQEQTHKVNEATRLCMYLRTKIKESYETREAKPIEMKIRKTKIELKDLGTFDPVILAQRLSMDYGDWKGRPLSELILEKGLKIKGTKRGASEDLNMKKRKTIRQ